MYRSSIVDDWLNQGRLSAYRATLLRQGKKKFGRAPTKKQAAELEAITDTARLEVLSERLLDVNTWSELLTG